MKVLLIGMDGAHLDAFNRGWTPFISSLLKNKKQLSIKNDLLSRGWLEIATGQHASRTGAMYDMPKANGSIEWKSDFCIHDVPGLGKSIKPLWQALNDKGYSVGVMNLPTTFPAPKVDGFFVSGGGGGAPVTEMATEELCYPKEIMLFLNKNNYIVDDRLYQLVVDKNLTTPGEIFKRLAYKNQQRTISFIELNKKYNVDFGFVVYKTSSVLAETILNTELVRRENGDNKADDVLVDSVREYYERFDSEIKKLHEAFPESEIVFVSDHGTTARTHSVNVNVFLQENNFQYIENRKVLVKNIVGKIKEIIPFSIKAYLKKTSVMKAKNIGLTNFDSSKTLAFCKTQGDWSHGIYINDVNRFGGPVEDYEISKIKADIIKSFNSNPEAIKHKLFAYSKEEYYSQNLNIFPDIIIDVPNGYLTTDKTSEFVSEFVVPKSLSALSSIMKGDILSVKSHTPLAAVSATAVESEPSIKYKGDLTKIYDFVLERFD